MNVRSIVTRFRAYQLGNAGSSFSFFSGGIFTLIEARYNETNAPSIDNELRLCKTNRIDNLHITSWDQDHCSPGQLEQILEKFVPAKIEYPGYTPHTQSGISSAAIIKSYKAKQNKEIALVQVTPAYISSLNAAKSYGYQDILHHPKYLDPDSANNNSTIKHFRSGAFNVLSLGDVESEQIAAGLRRQRTINSEVDIMILAHHGADNGFTTSSFIKKVQPTIAIASADYANQFAHPKQKIRDLLHKYSVQLFTTKTGDVVIYSTGNHTSSYKVENLKSNSEDISSSYVFKAKKSKILNMNIDSIRALTNRNNKGPKR